jgi:putative acyl-CoA dehydrogenase
MLPRLYREAPLNGIWEGSGNVICLDILRAMERDPGCLEVLIEEIRPAAADDRHIAAGLEGLHADLRDTANIELRARRVAETMAKLLQAAGLRQHGPTAIADAYSTSRLGDGAGAVYGTLQPGVQTDVLIERVLP